MPSGELVVDKSARLIGLRTPRIRVIVMPIGHRAHLIDRIATQGFARKTICARVTLADTPSGPTAVRPWCIDWTIGCTSYHEVQEQRLASVREAPCELDVKRGRSRINFAWLPRVSRS